MRSGLNFSPPKNRDWMARVQILAAGMTKIQKQKVCKQRVTDLGLSLLELQILEAIWWRCSRQVQFWLEFVQRLFLRKTSTAKPEEIETNLSCFEREWQLGQVWSSAGWQMDEISCIKMSLGYVLRKLWSLIRSRVDWGQPICLHSRADITNQIWKFYEVIILLPSGEVVFSMLL